MLRCTVICLALLGLSAAASPSDRRSARSIWPFAKSEATTDVPIITEEHNRLLEQAGLGKSFNFSSHPLWKIHKYQGIDLKPVHVKTEIVSATSPEVELPAETTTEAVDLSFLDDLGGLAYFLPEPTDNEGEVDEATDLVADAIKEDEEKEQQGFLKGLWRKIVAVPRGLYSSIFGESKEVAEANDDDDDSTTIYLPETQGSYVAVVVPSSATPSEELLPSSHVSQFAPLPEQTPEEHVPSNHASHYREIPSAPQAPARPSYHRSESWVQSSSPHHSYTVHIKGEPINNNLDISERSKAERKIGQDDEVEETTQQPQEMNDEEYQEDETVKELLKLQENGTLSTDDIAYFLNNFSSNDDMYKKYVRVKPSVLTKLVHDKTMNARALKSLMAKQPEFDTNWKQLRYSYPRVRKQNQETTTIITTGDES
ncbi:hypothetical protein TSAR_013037 [Trichomalopsis sarcophagae]|uniref:Uncharacterized protein n=1 Tax=Trichomalopsis sarcophagae TaxID=543379 RepID=A0A232F4P4_9HYME|nr:hypothetical protein TSAR_013037 [Trichomalopsis sarcophagae]